MQQTEVNIHENIQEFWNFVNGRKKNGCGLPDLMKNGDEVASNNKQIADLFAKFFGNVYKDDILPKLPPYSVHVNHDSTLNSLISFISLTHPLYLLYNKSLSSGIFPAVWKLAHVSPIIKSGPTYDVSNYRPISLRCVISKVFESIITDELVHVFKHLISPSQHGFFQNRSCSTNLFGDSEELHRCMDMALQVDVIYTDFSKAFDSVNQRILIEKLVAAGASGIFLDWHSSYILNRQQVVKINTAISEPKFCKPSEQSKIVKIFKKMLIDFKSSVITVQRRICLILKYKCLWCLCTDL